MNPLKKSGFLVALCGRTNVGKSTLFNVLTEKKRALVSDIPGTTRDSNFGSISWRHQDFNIVDTAGLLDNRALKGKKIKNRDIDSQTQNQARSYLDQADLILFIVDNKDGLLPEDKMLAEELKKSTNYLAKTRLVANKVDSFRLANEAAQFYKLGLGEPLIISAATGMGTGDLLDIIVEEIAKNNASSKTSITKKTNLKQAQFKKDRGEENETDSNIKNKIPKNEGLDDHEIKLCIIGQPNVGKSSLLNSLLGYERVIVSPTPHTTREPQDTEIAYQKKSVTIIDTAGISRRKQKAGNLEKAGIAKSLQVLSRADIALLIIDISQDLTHQDAKLVEEIVERGKSLIIVANKWDLITDRNSKHWTAVLYDKLPFATWAPIQFISAKTGEKVAKILDLALSVAHDRQLRLSDSQCEKFMKAVIKMHKPAKGKGLRAPRLYEFRQKSTSPPIFNLRIGPNDDLHFSYIRFMTNRLRERHGFIGTPIKINITKNKKSHTTYNEGGLKKK